MDSENEPDIEDLYVGLSNDFGPVENYSRVKPAVPAKVSLSTVKKRHQTPVDHYSP